MNKIKKHINLKIEINTNKNENTFENTRMSKNTEIELKESNLDDHGM
jgi:hypothetical protein